VARKQGNAALMKPCPFCGSTKVSRVGERLWFWTVCDKCCCSRRGAKTRRKADALWNMRAMKPAKKGKP